MWCGNTACKNDWKVSWIVLRLIIFMAFIEREVSSASCDQDKAVSEHSIPLGEYNIYYYDCYTTNIYVFVCNKKVK